jgi:hypothetical protein
MVINQPYYRITAPCPCLAKYGLLAKRHSISHDIITDPGKLIAYGLSGYKRIRLGSLPLVIALKLRVISPCKMARLNKGPAQITVTVFTIPFTLAFAS